MYSFNVFKRSLRRQAGYTLLELAVVLVVAGLLLASFATAYNLYLKTQAEKVTDDRISGVTAAMSTYLVAFGSYPCPARANATRSDPDYGIATQCDPTQTTDNGVSTQPFPYPCSAAAPQGCTLGAHLAGTCESGLCWQTSDRTVQTTSENHDILAGGGGAALDSVTGTAVKVKVQNASGAGNQNFDVTLPTRSPLVRRGMVPFRSLGLTEDQAYDGYNMRLSYAVTEALAVPGSYLEGGGAVDIQDGSGHTLFVPPGIPALDASGNYAIDQNGNPILVQTDGGAAHYVIVSAGQDRAGAYGRDGKVGVACPAAGFDSMNCATAPSAVYNAAPFSMGNNASHFDDHIKFYSESETPLWKVSNSTTMDIEDLIQAGPGGGKIGIGGTVAASAVTTDALQVNGDVHTSTNMVATQGLRNHQSLASTLVTLPLTSSCPPANPYATGLSQGTLNCAASSTNIAASCPPGQVAQGFNGTQMSCAQDVYCPSQQLTLCKAPTVSPTDQRWLPASPNATVVVTTSLTSTSGVTGFSGSSYQETWKCNGGTWKKTATAGVCSCTTLNNVPQSQTCASYYGQSNASTYTGNVTWTKSVACPSGTTTTTAKDHSACICNNLNINNTGSPQSCSPGYTGGPLTTTSTSVWTCSNPGGDGAGTWTGSSNTTGTCTCDPTYPPLTQDAPCPTGYNGTVHQTNSWVCSGNNGSWAGWTPVIGNPPPSDCTCTGATDYNPNVPCGSGQTGTKTQVRTFDCSLSPPDWTGWTDYDTSQCGTLTYIWKPVGTPDKGSYSTPLSNQGYQSCSTQGASGDCSVPNNGSYIYYLNNGCQCE